MLGFGVSVNQRARNRADMLDSGGSVGKTTSASPIQVFAVTKVMFSLIFNDSDYYSGYKVPKIEKGFVGAMILTYRYSISNQGF